MTDNITIDWPAELQQHQGWLKKVLRCRIGDSHAVEDVLQEVVVAVLRQLDATKQNQHDANDDRGRSTLPTDPQKVGPWLYRVAIRHAINFHRKQNRRSQAKPVADMEVVSSESGPLDWMLNRESKENLQQALNQLADGEREILMLKFSENWSYQQLADHVGISVRAVEHRLLKAKKHLRAILVASIQPPNNQEATDAARK